MRKTPVKEELLSSFPHVVPTDVGFSLKGLFTYLAFRGHMTRMATEMVAAVGIYLILVKVVFPPEWSSENSGKLFGWFIGCTLVAAFDQLLLRRSNFLCRRAYLTALNGAYEKALNMLEGASPYGKALVPCPSTIYHALRTDIFTQAEAYAYAERELEIASQAGLPGDLLAVLNIRLLRQRGELNFAMEKIEFAKQNYSQDPTLIIEEGLMNLENLRDPWAARKLFRLAAELPAKPHISGDSTVEIAHSYLEVCRLWTGEAEEGLEGLSRSIDRLRGITPYVDTLRPVLAQLCAERSYYLATHKEPEAAYADLKLAVGLCTNASLRKRATEVQEELVERHGLLLPV